MRVILFNGGIECGKDTIARLLADELRSHHQDVVITGFKAALFDAVRDEFELSPAEWAEFMDRYNDRATKEQKWERLYSDRKIYSPRGAMIHVSEDIYKPRYGNEAFGLMLVDHLFEIISEKNVDYFICPDSGFIDELKPLCEKFDVLFFSLRGRGTFEGDSRRLLHKQECLDAGVAQYQIVNLVDGHPVKGMVDVMLGIRKFING